MEKENYKFEKTLFQDTLDKVPMDVIERQFIQEFLSKLPLEKLKRLIDLKLLNPADESLWDVSEEQDFQLSFLREMESALLKANIDL
ncbi:hypothetical protein G6N05_05460 [Flavobacterium sp. F372]|uniref:Uncharacterized protein n=1 Tax=Flavobacterium bernardetii TaxID=2813823 RepID=A0ABR7J1D6_9FLAO|nr:hypothetical protein [Flavobacterium bernardetii]MBC5835828.1 hypothetical protein [Flavobacterium bernardetii]NHF69558.1 hypothetical protein [Flavobacterium bernardetii]